MDIWETNKLLLFIGFVIPGFVSLKIYELLLPSSPKESSKQLIDAVAYSCVNYALLLWPIYEVETSQIRTTHPSAYIAFYVFVLIIAPVAWACLFKKLRTTQHFQAAMPHPTAKPWDYVGAVLEQRRRIGHAWIEPRRIERIADVVMRVDVAPRRSVLRLNQ